MDAYYSLLFPSGLKITHGVFLAYRHGVGIEIKGVTPGGQAAGCGNPIAAKECIAQINGVDVRRAGFDFFKKELLSKEVVNLKIIKR
jgi:hypothetical protein